MANHSKGFRILKEIRSGLVWSGHGESATKKYWSELVLSGVWSGQFFQILVLVRSGFACRIFVRTWSQYFGLELVARSWSGLGRYILFRSWSRKSHTEWILVGIWSQNFGRRNLVWVWSRKFLSNGLMIFYLSEVDLFHHFYQILFPKEVFCCFSIDLIVFS